MRKIRLHVDQPLQPDAEISIDQRAADHACRVLRLGPGDRVTLFNGDGNEYAACLLTCGRDGARVRINAQTVCDTESLLALTLVQGVARGDKMDFIVQKATELGVVRIVPVLSERSEVRLDDARAAKRRAHWRAVAISACEQSGRAQLPAIAPVQALKAWCGAPTSDDALRLALLPQATVRVRDLTLAGRGAVLAVGPEGGFGEGDLAALLGVGFTGLRLGPRILRSETAGIAALTALQAVHGDI